jgi:hypothetical protein
MVTAAIVGYEHSLQADDALRDASGICSRTSSKGGVEVYLWEAQASALAPRAAGKALPQTTALRLPSCGWWPP